MEKMINFGIDLGTTNSAIGKFVKGEVQLFNNPSDYGRNSLPSIVAFKKDKIFIGSSAKTYYDKDPKSVVGLFKRKMGTSESFKIKAINESKTPIELSSYILKELKTFLPPNEVINSVVITIPASFDTIQSNATKEAGHMAGFEQIILLQEPIAASLAFANMKKTDETVNGTWLVYDLGGGTFDVALIKITDGEMRVLDHEGDNYLGGTDFDSLIVEKFIIPQLENRYVFSNLEEDLKSSSGKYNSKYYVLLRKAEDAKILLSSKTSAELVIDGFEDENGNDIDIELILTRTEFNEMIKVQIDNTISMVKSILTRNSIIPLDVQFILMVGGSTYIPYVRQRVEEVLGIEVNFSIDPTTAVVVGAAYYAAGKPIEISDNKVIKESFKISIKAAYQKTSKEKEEIFSAKVSGDLKNLSYRIFKSDGSYDSGLKNLTERINEDLPIAENSFNSFSFTIYDQINNVVETNFNSIEINSGFSISGQPLPEDICIEIDDSENTGQTKLEVIFPRNTILPSRKTMTKQLNRTVIKGAEDKFQINIYEGPKTTLPEANKTLGQIQISGKIITGNVSKGSDIELTFSMTESRDLTVSCYITMTDQEITEVFNPKMRSVIVSALRDDIEYLSNKLQSEITEATKNENFEIANELSKLKFQMQGIEDESNLLNDNDVTDKRYQIEDKKMKMAQAIDNATKEKRTLDAKQGYDNAKNECQNQLNINGNDIEFKHFNDIVSQEHIFLSSNSPTRINEITLGLYQIISRILWRSPDFLTNKFENLSSKLLSMNNMVQAQALIDSGKFAIESENWDRLSEIDSALYNLLPKSAQTESKSKIGFK